MPSKTFYNLPKEKKQTIIQAAQNEFSRASLSEASIANIVKEAEIPRGSFYQYFDDKEDLYFYILNDYAKDRSVSFKSMIQNNEGDIFDSITDMFHSMLREIENDQIRQFHKNVFLNMNYKTEKAFMNNINLNGFNKQYTDIKHLINKDNLNVANDEELFHIVQIIATMMIQNIVRKFAKDVTNEDAIKNFTIQLGLLKKGFEMK